MPFVRGAETGFVRVANPLAENEAFLRREVLDTLSRRAEYNLARMQGDLRLFEIGAVFLPDESMPHEELHVAALIMGRRRPPHFTDPKSEEFERAMTLDAWDAKALAELVCGELFGSGSVELTAGNGDVLWELRLGERRVGVVRTLALDAPVWAKPAFGVELSLGVVDSTRVAPPGQHAYRVPEYAPVRAQPFRAIPSQPASTMDLALLVPASVDAGTVEKAIRDVAGDLLESILLFDEHTGGKIEAGVRSLAWRLTFRHPERTLSAKEMEGRRTNVLRHLEKTLNVRPRST